MHVHTWVCLPARLRVPAWGEVAPRSTVNRLNKFLSKSQQVSLQAPTSPLNAHHTCQYTKERLYAR